MNFHDVDRHARGCLRLDKEIIYWLYITPEIHCQLSLPRVLWSVTVFLILIHYFRRECGGLLSLSEVLVVVWGMLQSIGHTSFNDLIIVLDGVWCE